MAVTGNYFVSIATIMSILEIHRTYVWYDRYRREDAQKDVGGLEVNTIR